MVGTGCEEAFVSNVGVGGNGKSKFVSALAHVLGDYCVGVPYETLIATKFTNSGSGQSEDTARLAGARMVMASENNQQVRLDEAKIKRLTGRNTITARMMHKGFFDFIPVFTLWLESNDDPKIIGCDDGIWRRIKKVEWKAQIADSLKDKNLDSKLEAEASGILNWMLSGCMEWQRIGLDEPEAVKKATKEYRQNEDVLQQFIDECCERGAVETKSSSLYTTRCMRNGRRETTNFASIRGSSSPSWN
jgi:putative DNA primase/helicase